MNPHSRVVWGVLWDTAGRDVIGPLFCSPGEFACHYDGEPSQPLLFVTRRHARAWCAKQHRQYAAGRTDLCGKWRWRPVRVRETLRVVGR